MQRDFRSREFTIENSDMPRGTFGDVILVDKWRE
jgi:hypothetical protein